MAGSLRGWGSREGLGRGFLRGWGSREGLGRGFLRGLGSLRAWVFTEGVGGKLTCLVSGS